MCCTGRALLFTQDLAFTAKSVRKRIYCRGGEPDFKSADRIDKLNGYD